MACSEHADPTTEVAGPNSAVFVDERACGECHADYLEAWKGSHHDLAMQEASTETVIAPLVVQAARAHNSPGWYAKPDGSVWMVADGPTGNDATYRITHTFGIWPLQQYVVRLDSGRQQVTSVAWDVERGRWFDTQTESDIDHADELHWTRPSHNWNYMCAECHATGFTRGYDAATNTFRSTAHRMDVGCQACHGPASAHVESMRSGKPLTASGLVINLSSSTERQVEACARCHSRRGPLGDGYSLAGSLHDDYRVALLDEDLYYADGQIKDEVYVYGSFIQSKMFHAGVRCTDCHDPHRATVKLPGNDLCITCHNAEAPAAGRHVQTAGLRQKDYTSSQHHHHKQGEGGSACVDCHAPTTTYMGVDRRHDHSFRIPRPDLSERLGTPNACVSCHGNKTNAWASATVAAWYGTKHGLHYGEVLQAGRKGAVDAGELLRQLIATPTAPAIVRATALDLLKRYPSKASLNTAREALRDASALVRRGAIAAHQPYAREEIEHVLALSQDPIRSVRLEVVPLIDVLRSDPRVVSVVAEYEDVQKAIGGDGSGPLNLGSLRMAQGRIDQAETLFRQAIAENELFAPAWVNLAEAVRQRSETEAETILRGAIRKMPRQGILQYALSLNLWRQKQASAARESMVRATNLDPENQQFRQALRLMDEALAMPKP